MVTVYEMCHKISSPINNRVFPVLVIAAERGTDQTIVAQVPIDIKRLDEALYSNGKHLDLALGRRDDPAKSKKVTLG